MATEREAGSLAHLPGGRTFERAMGHAAFGGADDGTRELLVRIAELEEDAGQLQRICDERQRVIDELKQAADERLRLVETLHATAAERLEAIRELETAVREGKRK
jgi:hypothetical protein